jgi:hypothetical protein
MEVLMFKKYVIITAMVAVLCAPRAQADKPFFPGIFNFSKQYFVDLQNHPQAFTAVSATGLAYFGARSIHLNKPNPGFVGRFIKNDYLRAFGRTGMGCASIAASLCIGANPGLTINTYQKSKNWFNAKLTLAQQFFGLK